MKLSTLSLIPFMALGIFCVKAEETTNIVTFDNFSNVESSKQIERYQGLASGVNKWLHFRTPTPIDKQPTIRMNRDTLYSFAVVDASAGASITLPKSNGRYQSLMLVNENGYTNKVWYGEGTYQLTPEVVGSDYALVLVRTFVDANDPEDVKQVNQLQDELNIQAKRDKLFEIKQWDEKSYNNIYVALTSLFKMLPNADNAFGSKGEVDPVRFVLGTAGGYGGLPAKDAFYANVSPGLTGDKYELTLKDVPADGFWSFSLYNKDGYFFKSKHGLSNINSVTAKPNADGSFTIYFGGCDTRLENCLAIEPGWNFVARFYQPREAILNGSWMLPPLQPSK
ncbi:DUF1214 domain-containing protein [Shewanella pneumatophori]|uniref:DUF1214 domain-containing protein n=1 Tax=Shewanella pneumatophori TaxID=314092 RepID=A0A9X1Z9T0_9GAMM|nr:DUF1214 domain-containing protein [Shewanella pneumatophori]MCL1137603.1 DUF1214 domain-containing protein [Shewanella pneumatophori]